MRLKLYVVYVNTAHVYIVITLYHMIVVLCATRFLFQLVTKAVAAHTSTVCIRKTYLLYANVWKMKTLAPTTL